MSATFEPGFIWAVIVGMALTNYAMRLVPMALLSRWSLPKTVMRWLSYIPIAVMGALFAQQILLPALEDAPTIPLVANPGIWGGLCAMVVFKLTRSFMGSSVAGVVVYVLMRALLGLG